MIKRVSERGECVYCGSKENITADHVPPKCLFPDPKPTNLITVPACEKCNNSYKKDDEYFRICVLTQPYNNPTGWKIWEEKVIRRTLRRSPSLRKRLLDNLIRVELRSPSGVYLGEGEALQFHVSRINRVVKRIVRGLYWYHYGSKLAPEIGFLITKDSDVSGVTDIINNYTDLSFIDKETFQYRHGIAAEDPDQSIWVLRFYTITTFLVLTGKDQSLFP